MPKGMALSPEQREKIYSMYLSGMRQAEIAELFGIHSVTVSKVVSGQRKLREERDMSEVVVAGDKKNGRLVSHGKDRFEGTCLIAGKMKRRTFSAPNAQRASIEWEKWCQTLRDEQDFMDMVERKREPLNETAPVEDAVDITPAPIPEISVRPWKEVAEERQQRIDELEARIAELEDKERKIGVMDMVIAGTEGETPKLGHWFNNNGSFRVMWMEKPVYVLWAKTDKPRIYGVYRTIESALSEVDKLNEVAAFLGGDGAFEVEEVAWKG